MVRIGEVGASANFNMRRRAETRRGRLGSATMVDCLAPNDTMVVTFPDSPYELHQPFPPAGDQPEAIDKLVEGISDGLAFQTLLGVTGSGKTYTMANVIARTGRPALVLAPNKTLAAQLYSEFREFLPGHSVEYFVSYYDYYQPEAYVPSRDLYIEKDSSINEHIEQMRLSATKAILERPDCVIVATVSAIYGIGDPSEYHSMILHLRQGDRLVAARRDQASDRAAVPAQRHRIPARNVSRARRRDRHLPGGARRERDPRLAVRRRGRVAAAVRSADRAHQAEARRASPVFPSSHYVTGRHKVLDAVEAIKVELAQQKEFFVSQMKLIEAQRIEQRTRFDIEMMLEIGFCKGIENYSRHLSGRKPGEPPPTLVDYLPANALVFIDESHVTIPQVGGMYRGDRARKENLVNYGFRLPSALDNRPLRFDEFEQLLPQTIFVSATPADYERKHAGQVVEQVVRPDGAGRPDRSKCARRRRRSTTCSPRSTCASSSGERVLVTTLTKRMAEDLTDYLNEHGVKVRYLHSDIDTVERVEIIRDLRLGEFDVLVGINLLREGLDIPEVSLVAVLDADKEGFLRAERSLIQTIGRAARHINGTAILYADKMTDSMNAARSAKPIAGGASRSRTTSAWASRPRACRSGSRTSSTASTTSTRSASSSRPRRRTPSTRRCRRRIWNASSSASRSEMLDAASNLEFEKAAELRDRLYQLKEKLFGVALP